MQLILISYYKTETKSANVLKTFILIDDIFIYFISTWDNKITIIRKCPSFEGSILVIAMHLAFNTICKSLPIKVKEFFDSNHKEMNENNVNKDYYYSYDDNTND